MKTFDLVVVCQVFHPDAQSTSQLLSAVLQALSVRGVRIAVVAGFPGGFAPEEAPHCEVWNGISIIRGGARPGTRRSLVARVVGYVTFLNSAIIELLRLPRASKVLVVTNPPFGPILSEIVAVFKRHRTVIMLQDIYPDGLTALGTLKHGGVVDLIWRLANRWAFQRASGLWVLGRDMKERVQTHYGVSPKKVSVIPHWAAIEFEEGKKFSESSLAQRLCIAEKFVVQYSGNMGLWHDLECIVYAAARLSKHKNIHFVFIGSGIKRQDAERLSEKLKLSNTTWLPSQPLESLHDSLSCSHVAIISQIDGLFGVAVPCKLYGILSSGRAIIAQVPRGTEVALVVDEERCGVVVTPGDAKALADEILKLSQDRETVARMGRLARSAYLQKYSIEHASNRVLQAMHNWWPAAGR
jgi:glycosyltransferase involved in cell wall biosynthesis